MPTSKIVFKFAANRFQYDLPLLGVDLEFLAARKAEVIDCMKQLARKIPDINIASKEGVADFNLANDLVRHYFYALCTITRKEKMLTEVKAEPTEQELEAISVYMREQYRERTI